MSYTLADVEKAERNGDVVNGVPFDWWLVNSDGAGFVLLPIIAKHTKEQVQEAKIRLRNNRDVVGKIGVHWITP